MSVDGLPDIDFARIRPYGPSASRASALEELASILIEQGVVEWPAGTKFERFGNPDGGREGRGVLPNGVVWAWQVKNIFEFDASAASQVTASVERVLDSEPRLTRYFVVLPIDLSAGDTDKRATGGKRLVSANTRWTGKVQEWQKAALARGMDVEFTFIGAHELVTALTEPRHTGRLRYWFATDVLTPEWQERRTEEVIAKAGPRYTPEVHIEVDAVQALYAACRSESYVGRWQQVLSRLREARHTAWRVPAGHDHAFTELFVRCGKTLDDADAALSELIAAAGTTGELPSVEEPLTVALGALEDLEDRLLQEASEDDRSFTGDAGALYAVVRKVVAAVGDGIQLADSGAAQAAAARLLLLAGRSGAGKTHLLCQVARERTAERQPTIVLFGQDFSDSSLLPQIGDLSQLGRTLDDVLGVLNAASEAAGCTGLLIIDALNESERPYRWRDDLRVLEGAARRHPHVALVVSCRTEYLEDVVDGTNIPRVEHSGFGEATAEAVRRFAKEYGIEVPTFPVLNPEFSNPLYLKLACSALRTLGPTRFPLGTAGLTTITSAFIQAVNERLATANRCDYDARRNLVEQCVRQLAGRGRVAWDRDEVKRITEEALPDRRWSRSLMNGLMSEGILIELHDRRVTFGYQRLGDVARAALIAERSPDGIREWLRGLDDETWMQRGILSALAVMVPELHGTELIDLDADKDGAVPFTVIDSFIDSLLLRSPESVTLRTVKLVENLLQGRYRTEDILDCLVRIACVPGHPLNAEWLHGRLAALSLADRDMTWSIWLTGSTDPGAESGPGQLIDWAWPHNLQDRPAIPDDVAFLAAIVLGWFLTTSDRRVRDKATKALVSIAELTPSVFGKALALFSAVNDPYVIERLAAAACGVVLRNPDATTSGVIADAIVNLAGDQWPQHLLTRDYMRRVLAVARCCGWQGPDGRPPYGSRWPVQCRTTQEIEELAGPPSYEYGSIWRSLTGMGDFGRYVLQSALRNITADNPENTTADAERAIFDRVLELGWTPERFRGTDSRRSLSPTSPVERVGKKYEWIGLHEVLGRITDAHDIGPTWRSPIPHPYGYPEQLTWRDIDPTILARKVTASQSAVRPWFSPAEACFPPGIVTDYPTDMTAIPDPLDLIAVRDVQGSSWLVLASHPQWKQQLPPEVEAMGVTRREAWMQITAYLVPISDMPALRGWARQRDWTGRWMPEAADIHNVLLGAYPDDPQWLAADGSISHWDTSRGGVPKGLTLAAAYYSGIGVSRDCSAEPETTGYVPSHYLHDILNKPLGVDFRWIDASGTAVQDPSVIRGGPATLAMRRDLLPRLAGAGLTIFWTILIGNELNNTHSFTPPGGDYRWVSASASYTLNGLAIELIYATAAIFAPGPEIECQVEWTPRNTETCKA